MQRVLDAAQKVGGGLAIVELSAATHHLREKEVLEPHPYPYPYPYPYPCPCPYP